MGYELEVKVKFEGRGKWEGLECAISASELCDDGSDPETKLFVTKENGKDQGTKFKQEMASEQVIDSVISRFREILGIIRDEA